MVHSSCGQWACPGSVLVQQQLLLLLLQVHIWWMMKLLPVSYTNLTLPTNKEQKIPVADV